MIDGFVLAGGRSRRMGVDKARVAWGDLPLAVVVAERVRAVCQRVALVRRGPADGLPWPDADGQALEVLAEPDDGEPHPLWGVATALAAARTPLAVLAPCDVPWLTGSSLARLVEAAPSVAVSGGRVHPLVAVVEVSRAERARDLARQGRPAGAFADGLTHVALPEDDLRNVNDPGAVPRPGPVARLLARVPWATDAERTRLVAGEVARLAARGMVDPRVRVGRRMAPHDHHHARFEPVTVHVIVVSTTRTEATDVSGRRIAELVAAAGHTVGSRTVVDDDVGAIRAALAALAGADVVILTGGTGAAPRDVTPEAVEPLYTRRLDGFGEVFRAVSYQQIGSAAWLSRASAGLVGSTAVFLLPGSTAACELAVGTLILPELGHLARLIRTPR